MRSDAAARRVQFRDTLASGRLIVAPGAHNGLTRKFHGGLADVAQAVEIE